MNLIPAGLKDEALIADADALREDAAGFHLWWLGQSGFLLQWKGFRVLFDPYLSDSLTKKYADTNKAHIRMSERVIDPTLLRNIGAIASSHNHTDHLDAETLVPIIFNNPSAKLVIPEANRQFVADRLKCNADFPVGLTDGQSAALGEFVFHGVPASHNSIERDSRGNSRFMGYVLQFGDWHVYHSGDTLWFEGMEELLRPFHIDVALLPINGNDPSRGVAGNLSAREAAELGHAIGAKHVIPCHYDMFTFNTADPNDFARAARDIRQPFSVLQPGQRWSSGALATHADYL